jgi:hypothetical protein
MHTFFGKHGDHVEGNIFAAQQPNSIEGAIEGAFSGAGHTVCIVEMARPVDTDTHANVPFLDEVTPILGE